MITGSIICMLTDIIAGIKFLMISPLLTVAAGILNIGYFHYNHHCIGVKDTSVCHKPATLFRRRKWLFAEFRHNHY